MKLMLSAAMALVCLLFLASGANAATFRYACTGTAGELQPRLNGTSAWTVGGTMKPAAGDTIEIDGTTNNAFCLGDVFVNTSGLTFKNHTGTDGVIPADVIDGMFEVAGARITIDGILLLCPGCSASTANTTGLSAFDEDGALLLHDGAAVVLENVVVADSPTSGIYLTGNSAITVLGSTIAGNGQNPSGVPFSSGIFAGDASSVRLGNPDGSSGVTVAGNGKNGGGCPGFGIVLTQSSALQSFNATIGGAGTTNDGSSQNTCGQLLLESGSSARIEGNTITQTTAGSPAIQALASSSFITAENAASAFTSISSGNNGAVLLGAASSAVLNESTIISTGTSVATVEASGNSTATLAGGNIVSNSSGGGIVFQIDHSSSLVQIAAHQFGFTDAPDEVSGSAFIQVQSSADVGIGLITGVPSLSWTVSSGDCILIQQNSSFRLSGGVAIAGAPAAACSLNGGTVTTTIAIQQESNAFFNLGHGGALAISGGGGVSCIFTTFPNAHVNGKGNITPAGAQPVMIGSWVAALMASSPGCLGP